MTYSQQIRDAVATGEAMAHGQPPIEGDFEIPGDEQPPRETFGKADATGRSTVKRGRTRKAAAEPVEEEEAGVGHNSKALLGDEKLIAFVWNVLAFNAQEHEIRGKRRAYFAAAQKLGIDLKIGKQIVKELKGGAQELAEHTNSLNYYRRLVDLPAADDVREPARITDEDERLVNAQIEGRLACYRGTLETMCPHSDPGLPAAQAWVKGHREAYAKVEKASLLSVIRVVVDAAERESEG